MDSGVQVSKAVQPHSGGSSRPIMSPSRLAKLPPISSAGAAAEQGAQNHHPSTVFLENTTSELKDTMQHLLCEAQSAETRIQQAIDALWQKMMEMLEKRTQDYEVQLTRTIDELQTTKEQLVKITAQEAALVQQNAKMSMELVAQENSQKKLKSEMKCVKEQLKSRETELGKMKEEAGKMKTKHQGTEESLEKELEEKNKTLKDYQEKLIKMTEKLQKVTKTLTEEKAAAEKLQKSNTSQITQQTSDNRKMALEISKLKSQLATSSTALAASKEEVRKFEIQLKKLNSDSETTVTSLRIQHTSIVTVLEKKIADLQQELAELQSKHEAEIALLKEQLEKLAAEGDDGYLDARIRFLQHQNRQEKIKISKERKKQS